MSDQARKYPKQPEEIFRITPLRSRLLRLRTPEDLDRAAVKAARRGGEWTQEDWDYMFLNHALWFDEHNKPYRDKRGDHAR